MDICVHEPYVPSSLKLIFALGLYVVAGGLGIFVDYGPLDILVIWRLPE